MDQHPIPQDVTGFQFKLIGTMTVKQFGYVACGVVMAVILYYLPLQGGWAVLLKLFVIPLMGASGVVVAFVPIDGRPIDIMTTNFVKAIFSPNQYVYRRSGRQLSFSAITITKQVAQQAEAGKAANAAKPLPEREQLKEEMNAKEEKLRAFLLNSATETTNEFDKRESAFLTHLSIPNLPPKAPLAKPVVPNAPKPGLKTLPTSVINPTTIPATTRPANPLPQITTTAPAAQPMTKPAVARPTLQTPTEQQNTALGQKEKQLEAQLQAAQQEEAATKEPTLHAAAQQKVVTMQQQIADVHAQKVKLEQELAKLQNQLAVHKAATSPAIPAAQTAPISKPAPLQATVQSVTKAPAPKPAPVQMKIIPTKGTKAADLPRVSDTPNVVVGIVKDSRGNILPNILVEVKDKDDNPIRAFKTNALGQFASATPLNAGTYTITLEDPKGQHQFDTIQIAVNNQIMSPIEIISHDAREQLHKELFATS